MTRRVVDAAIDVTKPGEDTPAFTIPAEHIGPIDIEEAAQEAMDAGGVEVDNASETYVGDQRVTSGDRLDIKTQLEGESSLSTRLVAVARDVTDVLVANGRLTLDIEFTDFVFTTLSWRAVDASFEDEDVGTIIDTLVANDAPEVGRSQIETLGVTTDAFVSGRYLLDVITEDLAAVGDAIVANDGTDLVVQSLSSVEPVTTLTPADFYTPIEVSRVDDELANRSRIDGGVDHAVDVAQETQSTTERVTETSRLVTQVPARKSEIARVQLFTELDSASDDGLVVRLQAARDGSPVDVDDSESDIARRKLSSAFLADGDFSTFLLPDHSLAPADEPFLIVEADGEDGQFVGTDGDGTATYRAEYPYPLIASTVDGASRHEYRRRDVRIRDEQLDTLGAVQDKAESVVRHRNTPASTVSAAAQSLDAHQLKPGEVARLDGFGDLNANGTYLCLDRTTEYGGTLLTTELTLQDTTTV